MTQLLYVEFLTSKQILGDKYFFEGGFVQKKKNKLADEFNIILK